MVPFVQRRGFSVRNDWCPPSWDNGRTVSDRAHQGKGKFAALRSHSATNVRFCRDQSAWPTTRSNGYIDLAEHHHTLNRRAASDAVSIGLDWLLYGAWGGLGTQCVCTDMLMQYRHTRHFPSCRAQWMIRALSASARRLLGHPIAPLGSFDALSGFLGLGVPLALDKPYPEFWHFPYVPLLLLPLVPDCVFCFPSFGGAVQDKIQGEFVWYTSRLRLADS